MQNVSSLVLVITLTHHYALYCVKYVSENINFPMKICGIVSYISSKHACEYLLEMPDIKAVLSSTKQSLL